MGVSGGPPGACSGGGAGGGDSGGVFGGTGMDRLLCVEPQRRSSTAGSVKTSGAPMLKATRQLSHLADQVRVIRR